MNPRWKKYFKIPLPLLASALLVSACGKDGKIVHSLASSSPIKKKSSSIKAGSANTQELNLAAFTDKCVNELKGVIESHATLCVYRLPTPAINPALENEQIILGNYLAGDLIISKGTESPSDGGILLAGQPFMKIGDRKIATNSGRLSFFVINKSSAEAQVSVWTCVNNVLNTDSKSTGFNKLDRVLCNDGILTDQQP